MNIIDQIEAEQLRELPAFRPGDTLRVHARIVEGDKERIQVFEGVCIRRSRGGSGASFTVRKISYGEGVERIFQLYSPQIAGIEVMRRGAVRRAKLYYLRGRTGKRARIAEKRDGRKPAKTRGKAKPAAKKPAAPAKSEKSEKSE